MAKKENPKPDEFDDSVFCCSSCPFETEKAKDIQDHLVSEHGYDRKILSKAKGKMVSHLDSEHWHQTTYLFEMDGLPVCHHHVRRGRRGDDLRIWSHP